MIGSLRWDVGRADLASASRVLDPPLLRPWPVHVCLGAIAVGMGFASGFTVRGAGMEAFAAGGWAALVFGVPAIGRLRVWRQVRGQLRGLDWDASGSTVRRGGAWTWRPRAAVARIDAGPRVILLFVGGVAGRELAAWIPARVAARHVETWNRLAAGPRTGEPPSIQRMAAYLLTPALWRTAASPQSVGVREPSGIGRRRHEPRRARAIGRLRAGGAPLMVLGTGLMLLGAVAWVSWRFGAVLILMFGLAAFLLWMGLGVWRLQVPAADDGEPVEVQPRGMMRA